MHLIDHTSVGVPEIASACAFYDPVMAALGITCLIANETLAAYGRDRVEFVIIRPADGGAPTAGNGVHVAFVAEQSKSVDAFHTIALSRGGKDEGAAGPRPGYPKPNVYAAFVRDPYGNKLEAIHNGFAA